MVARWRCLVLACPGSSRHRRAPRVSAPELLGQVGVEHAHLVGRSPVGVGGAEARGTRSARHLEVAHHAELLVVGHRADHPVPARRQPHRAAARPLRREGRRAAQVAAALDHLEVVGQASPGCPARSGSAPSRRSSSRARARRSTPCPTTLTGCPAAKVFTAPLGRSFSSPPQPAASAADQEDGQAGAGPHRAADTMQRRGPPSEPVSARRRSGRSGCAGGPGRLRRRGQRA